MSFKTFVMYKILNCVIKIDLVIAIIKFLCFSLYLLAIISCQPSVFLISYLLLFIDFITITMSWPIFSGMYSHLSLALRKLPLTHLYTLLTKFLDVIKRKVIYPWSYT